MLSLERRLNLAIELFGRWEMWNELVFLLSPFQKKDVRERVSAGTKRERRMRMRRQRRRRKRWWKGSNEEDSEQEYQNAGR